MTILATIIVLGVLIFVHELGHFLAAKLVGIEVQRFSIGLGPRLWGVRRGETEYVFSFIPLGGYVKMGGMADEVLEKVEGGGSAREGPRVPGPRDFDGKPIWARTLVISAGVIMNFLFAFVVYSVVAGVWGVQEPASRRVGEVYEPALPASARSLVEIPPGAELVRVGDRTVEDWSDVVEGFLSAPPGPLTVVFENPPGQVEITMPEDEEGRRSLVSAISPWIDASVAAVEAGSPAERGGLEQGDRILAVDDAPIRNWFDFLRAIEARPGARVEITIQRGSRELRRVVTLERVEGEDPLTGEKVVKGRIGVYRPLDEVVYTRVGPLQALTVGYHQTVGVTGVILRFLRDLVTGGVSPRSVGSIVTIGQASGQAAARGMDFFLSFMALFSVNLAVLNLLPIPVLDGGHLLFLGIEAVRGGRPLSVEQRMRWSQVGLVLLIGIMVWALSNDFLRILGL